MAKRKNQPPSYRLHRQSGQAVVTLTCAISGKRRDVLLGEHDTADSRVRYADAIAGWERDGRVLDNAQPQAKPVAGVASVTDIMLDWWEGVLTRYGVTDPEGRLPSRLYAQRTTVRLVRAVCGSTPASEFGPLRLQEVRQKMVDKGWSRGHVNQCTATVVQAFKQAVGAEKVRPEVVVGLQCVKPLRRGELGAPEGESIKPVPIAHVNAIKPHVSAQVWAVVEVMLLTGARCAEVCIMRAKDIEVGKVWTYRPATHKGEHHGHERLIHIGPKAQAVVNQFIVGRATDAYLFSPAEAEEARREARHEERVTPLSCGNRPGKSKVDEPKWKPGDRYTTESVRRAIHRACVEAGVPKWSPHMVRHTAATEFRRAAGVEAAAIILGHSSATLTDRVYAERDHAKAADIIGRVG